MALAACGLMLLAGCGGRGDRPDLALVKGTVTLDGNPLDKARVTFEPDEGRPSHGRTNERGEYELTYLAGAAGAKIGAHKVRVSTNDLIEDPETGARKMIPELVPPSYNENTELTAEVLPGKNEISFELKSR